MLNHFRDQIGCALIGMQPDYCTVLKPKRRVCMYDNIVVNMQWAQYEVT